MLLDGERLPAQGVRVTGVTSVQSIDLRPLRYDSIAAGQVAGSGPARRGPGGELVQCPEGAAYCYFSTSGARQTTSPLLQDLSVAAWGLGEGISAHAHVRARAAIGHDDLWPRLGDRFDALEVYVQAERSRGRLRLGRLWATNGLGAYNFDGGAILLRRGAQSLEVYGGRALVQGLSESYTSGELGAVDDLPPEDNGALVGARWRARPNDASAMSVVYQRVILADRSSLVSDRVAGDATTRWRELTLDAGVAYDLAGATLNEARARLSRRVLGATEVSLEGRRHRPFFELWTIWGAFAPVGFDEARSDLAWRAPGDRLHLTVAGAYRRYATTGTGVGFLPLRSDGWRAGLDATWTPTEQVAVSANYGVDIGVGASRSDATAGGRWLPNRRVSFGGQLTAFQSIYEFRVGTGRVLGAAVDGSMVLTPDLRVAMDVGVYRHRLTNDAPGTNWSQRRAAIRLVWGMGGDAGGYAGAAGGVR